MKLSCLLGIHQYVPIKATQIAANRVNWVTGTREIGVPATLILFKCTCNKFKTQIIEGLYTLNEIKTDVDKVDKISVVTEQ